jgi:hypothetical protein
MAKKKDEMVKKETALPASVYENTADVGFEDTTSDDYALPFLKLLQKMSPEVDPDSGQYLDGARPGMLLDSATGELMETVNFIPCFYRRAIVEWRDRDSGGGFVAHHEPGYEQQFQRDDSGRWVTPDGTYLADTRYFFGLRVREDGLTFPDVLSFSSTQIKKARGWLTRLQGLKFKGGDGSIRTFPIFAHLWQISSVAEENEKGSWRGYKVDLMKMIDDPNLMELAISSHHTFKRSAVNLKPVETDPTGEPAPTDVI